MSVLLLATSTDFTVFAEDISTGGAGGVKPHTHQWADTANATYHWQKCQFEGCTEIRNKATHNYVENGHSSCDDPVDYVEICSSCNYYHKLTKVHTYDNTATPTTHRCYHSSRCIRCDRIHADFCTNSAGKYLGCRGKYVEGYSSPLEGNCAVCGEWKEKGHGHFALMYVYPQNVHADGYGHNPDDPRNLVITDDKWVITTWMYCEDCGIKTGDAVITLTRDGSDNKTKYYGEFTLLDGWTSEYETAYDLYASGTCDGIGTSIYPTGTHNVTVLSSKRFTITGHIEYLNTTRPEVDSITSTVAETHPWVHYKQALPPEGYKKQPTAGSQFNVNSPYEWSNPYFTTDVTFTNVTKVNGWTTSATANFKAADAYSHLLYYSAGSDMGALGDAWGSVYSTGTSFNVSFMPEVEADANGRYVTFQIRDSAYNYGTKQVFLQKWDHKPPTPLTTEDSFSKSWTRTKSGTVSCTDYGIGEVVFEFNQYGDPTKEKPMTNKGNGKYSLNLNLEVSKGTCIGPNGTTKALYYTDGVGNPTTQYLKFYCFDNAAPNVEFVNPTTPYVLQDGKAYVALTGVDATCTNAEDLGAPGSGIKQFGYSTQDNPDSITWLPQGTTTATITKADYYHFWSKDNCDNVSEKIPAIFIPVDWYVEYHNTHNSIGYIPKQTIHWNDKANLSDGSPLRLNHSVLLGWSTDKNVKRAIDVTYNYNLGQEVCNAVKAGETLHLYAAWRPWWYTVTYHNNIPNQPDVSTNRNGVKYSYDVEYTPLQYPELASLSGFQREGYYIDRWSTSTKQAGDGYTAGNVYATGGKATFSNLAADTQNADLYAIWKGNPYTLIIHDNYKNCKCADETYTLHVGEDFILPQTANKHGAKAILLGYSYSSTFTTTPEFKPAQAIRDLTMKAGDTIHLYRIWDNPPTIESPAHLNIDRATAAAAGITFTETGAVKQADLELLLMTYAHAYDTEYPQLVRGATNTEVPAGTKNGYTFKISSIDPVQMREDLKWQSRTGKACNYVITYIVTDPSGNSATSVTELLFGNPDGDKNSWITILTGTR